MRLLFRGNWFFHTRGEGIDEPRMLAVSIVGFFMEFGHTKEEWLTPNNITNVIATDYYHDNTGG